jgi:AraC-like DNA-binding protein
LVVSAAGVAPKQLARIARFRRVTERLANDERPSAALALDCGYCDQAHMAREFRAFTGTTATDYARFHLSKTG